MIPLRDQELIREKFTQELKGPVKIDFFTLRPSPVFIPGRQECRFCPETEQMLSELAHLSDYVELRVHDLGADRQLEARYGIDRAPATVVRGAINRPLLFAGMPAGELFPVLLEAMIDVSAAPPTPPPAIKRKLKRLKRPVRVQVLVLPDAPYCAEMARLAQIIALSSQHIRTEIVEVSEFPEPAERHGVHAVPATIIDDKIVLTGLVTAEELVDQIVTTAERQTITARGTLITGSATQQSTPIAAPPPLERGQTRPSGLIIPGR